MARTPRSRFTLLAALAALAAAAILPATASASGCADQEFSKPFARWLDPFNYTLVPGGTFEPGAAAWTLKGGARVVSGNETWAVSGPGSHALSLPAGASATSPSFCAGLAYPTFRAFTRGTGLLLNVAVVEVLYRDNAGILRAAPLPNLSLTRSWAPTLPLPTLSGLPILTGSELALRITSVLGGTQVDDVYVDPWSRY
jgi:hypothetical protein